MQQYQCTVLYILQVDEDDVSTFTCRIVSVCAVCVDLHTGILHVNVQCVLCEAFMQFIGPLVPIKH